MLSIKMGQSRPLFVYFRPFLITISIIQIVKSLDGVRKNHWAMAATDWMLLWYSAFWKFATPYSKDLRRPSSDLSKTTHVNISHLLNSFMIVASYRITVNHTNSVKFLLDYVLPSSDENVDRALHRDEVSEEEIHAAIGECSAMKFFIRGMQFCS